MKGVGLHHQHPHHDPLATPQTTDNYSATANNNYSDSVAWDPRVEVYTIDVEIKSANQQSSDTRIID